MQCCYTEKKLFSDSDKIPLLARWGGIQLEWFQGSPVLCRLQTTSLFATYEWALGLHSWQLYHVWTVLRCFPEVLLIHMHSSCAFGEAYYSLMTDSLTAPYLPPAVADLLSLPFFISGWVLEIKSRVLGLCCSAQTGTRLGNCRLTVVWFTLPDVYDYIWYNRRPSQAFSSKGTHRFLAVSCRQDVCWINKRAENTEFYSSCSTGDAKDKTITKCSILWAKIQLSAE